MSEIQQNTIKQLSDKEHVLLRPQQYVGSTTLTKCSTFILNKEQDHFSYEEIEYIPAFLKIIYEVLDNSCDESIRTNYKFASNISVSIDTKENKITIKDDGRGIPLDNAEGTDISQLELALTELRAGSNFDDSKGRLLLGMNGVGASLTNVFSKYFEAHVFTGKKEGLLICKDNLSFKSCKIKNKKTNYTGTEITFIPDLERFGLKNIDNVHIDLIKQRLMFLSFTYPEIKFKFNGENIKFKKIKNFMNYFANKFVAIEDENTPSKYLIGIIPNERDEFIQKSYINGADCINGGNHIDYIHSELVGRIKDKLSKKYPSIKAGDIKNRLAYIINFREFLNPMFNSQTKENFSSNINEIKIFLSSINWDDVVSKILKTDEIIEPIIETFKIKEELKNRQALAGMSKVTKKFKCEKYLPATKENKYFAICEGDSATAGLVDGLGRKQIGYMATRGVPLNTYSSKLDKLIKNQELSDIIKILGIKLGAENQHMNYEKVLLASDQDCDGSHIRGLYIGFFKKYAPSVINEGKLCMLQTPLVCIYDSHNKIKKMFFNLYEYKKWEQENPNSQSKKKYFKGLGSWKPNELRELIEIYGIDNFIEVLKNDETSDEYIYKWLDDKEADSRKELLRKHNLDMEKI